MFWSGLFLLEVSLIIGFYVLPELQALRYSPPDGHWEKEFPLSDSSWLPVVALVSLGLFTVANAGLITMMWRAFKSRRG
jgi:hypothetical protein